VDGGVSDRGLTLDDVERLRDALYDASLYVAEDMRTPAHWKTAITDSEDKEERRALVKRWCLYQDIRRAMGSLPEEEKSDDA
jgi:hypothetical protein